MGGPHQLGTGSQIRLTWSRRLPKPGQPLLRLQGTVVKTQPVLAARQRHRCGLPRAPSPSLLARSAKDNSLSVLPERVGARV